MDLLHGTPAYSGPSAKFPTGPLSNVESFGAGQTRGGTPGAIAGSIKQELTQGTFVRGGGSVESHGIGVNTDRHA